MKQDSLLVMKRKKVRNFWIVANVISILITIILLILMIFLGLNSKYEAVKIIGLAAFAPFALIDIICLVFLIACKKVKVRFYNFEGHELSIFGGFRDHILIIDGQIVENTQKYFTRKNVVWHHEINGKGLRIEVSPYNDFYLVYNGQVFKDKKN